MRPKRRRFALATVAVAGLAACEGENPLDPDAITVEILTDQLSFSVSGLVNVTGGDSYLMALTSTQAVIDVTQSISSGTAIVQLRDGSGQVVYQENARDAVDDTTDVAEPGLWQVAVVMTKVTGGFSFTVQRFDTVTVP
jgi:hypothetical protein